MSWERLTPEVVEREVRDRTVRAIDAAYDMLLADGEFAREDVEAVLLPVIPIVERQIRGSILTALDDAKGDAT